MNGAECPNTESVFCLLSLSVMSFTPSLSPIQGPPEAPITFSHLPQVPFKLQVTVGEPGQGQGAPLLLP